MNSPKNPLMLGVFTIVLNACFEIEKPQYDLNPNDCEEEEKQEFFTDADEDGFGKGSVFTCTQPANAVTTPGDCNDEDASIHPDAVEILNNEIDENCDGEIESDLVVDESCQEEIEFFLDADEDGFGGESVFSCIQPINTVTTPGDCNDTDASIHPGASEVLDNGVDEDCNGQDQQLDFDNDGVPAVLDCDDNNAELGAVAQDADCDGAPTVEDCDDSDPSSTIKAEDADCDGILTIADCDDNDAESTGIAEDADCDGILAIADCDDSDAESTIIAQDADCDGTVSAEDCDDSNTESTIKAQDADCDSFVTADDCNDEDPTINPAALEILGNGIDEDCDGFDAEDPNAIDLSALDSRSVVENDSRALSAFQMSDLLRAVIENTDVNLAEFQILSDFMGVSDPENFLHDQFMDTYTTEEEGFFPFNHCDDEMTNGTSSINGFPLDCPRPEAEQQGNIDAWFPISIFNRFDMTPEDGEFCGEQRVVMANNVGTGGRRFFLIFEAQIPNPDPSNLAEGCAPIADFWAKQSLIDDPAERGERLRQAFLDGDEPDLMAAGFGAFMSAENFTHGSGQIRSNNFNNFTWSLREHKLSIFENLIVAETAPVTNNIFGGYFDDNKVLPNGDLCRDAILNSVESLSSPNPSDWSLSSDPACWAAESEASSTNNYGFQFASSSSDFAEEIEARIPSDNLTATNIVARAEFAGSCMGCHQNGSGRDLGAGVRGPRSLGFVHASEFSTTCEDGTRNCFRLSNALTSSFLPTRLDILVDFLGEDDQGFQAASTGRIRLGGELERRTIGGKPLSQVH